MSYEEAKKRHEAQRARVEQALGINETQSVAPVNLGDVLKHLTPDTIRTIIITPATAILAGTELRRIVGAEPAAPFARASRRFGDLVVELVRSHSTWRLYLADLAPVKHARRDLWATAVSAPSVNWQRTQDGCLVWCEWRETAP